MGLRSVAAAAAAAVLFGLAHLSTAAAVHPRNAPLPPTLDPFYAEPVNLTAYRPGQIIRSRPTPGSIGGVSRFTRSNIQASYQLFYRTTNTVGNAAGAVCTILIPHDPDFSKVLAYQAAYDSADEDCSPSYTLQQSSNRTTYDTLFMAAALNQGWVITTADYEGLNAAFVAGIGSGMATLDAVRATLASKSITGIPRRAKYALWGYSGGALASEWALELQPQYAPELSFIGAALGGLTPNATSVFLSVNNGIYSALALHGINGLMAAYSNLSSYVNQNLIPSKKAEFESGTTTCGNASGAAFKNVTSYFLPNASIFTDPVPQSVLKYGTNMGFRSIPTAPIYAYKAIGDEISVIADTDDLVQYYCANGARIQYVRNVVGEHVSEAITGSGGALAWLKARFDGQTVAPNCSTTNVAVASLTLANIAEFGVLISAALDLLLSAPLSPNSPIGL